jgi:hypothetical protein
MNSVLDHFLDELLGLPNVVALCFLDGSSEAACALPEEMSLEQRTAFVGAILRAASWAEQTAPPVRYVLFSYEGGAVVVIGHPGRCAGLWLTSADYASLIIRYADRILWHAPPVIPMS